MTHTEADLLLAAVNDIGHQLLKLNAKLAILIDDTRKAREEGKPSDDILRKSVDNILRERIPAKETSVVAGRMHDFVYDGCGHGMICRNCGLYQMEAGPFCPTLQEKLKRPLPPEQKP